MCLNKSGSSLSKRHDNQAINQSPIFSISTVYKKENPKTEVLTSTFTHSLTLPACTAERKGDGVTAAWNFLNNASPSETFCPERSSDRCSWSTSLCASLWGGGWGLWCGYISAGDVSFLWFSSQKSSQCLCGDFLTGSWNLSSILAVATGKLKTLTCFGQTVFYCQEI